MGIKPNRFEAGLGIVVVASVVTGVGGLLVAVFTFFSPAWAETGLYLVAAALAFDCSEHSAAKVRRWANVSRNVKERKGMNNQSFSDRLAALSVVVLLMLTAWGSAVVMLVFAVFGLVGLLIFRKDFARGEAVTAAVGFVLAIVIVLVML
jgi:hypothetical protein